jgi:hypothetical protein
MLGYQTYEWQLHNDIVTTQKISSLNNSVQQKMDDKSREEVSPKISLPSQ